MRTESIRIPIKLNRPLSILISLLLLGIFGLSCANNSGTDSITISPTLPTLTPPITSPLNITTTASPTALPAPTPTALPTPTPIALPTPTPIALPTPTPTALPTPTPIALPTPTATALPTPTATALPTPTPTALPAPTPALSNSIKTELKPSKDTTIYSESSKVSNGGGQFIFAGNNNQSDSRRALIMFDIPSSINSKSQVVNVELSLEMDRAREGAFQVALYKLTNEWSEGSSQGGQGEGAGGTIQGLDATWKNRIHPGHAWIKRGGDFEIEPSAVSMVKGPGSYTWSGPRLNEDVQNWINGTHRNYGWILIGDESESITAKRFSSRTGPSAPVLEIEYIFN